MQHTEKLVDDLSQKAYTDEWTDQFHENLATADVGRQRVRNASSTQDSYGAVADRPRPTQTVSTAPALPATEPPAAERSGMTGIQR